MIGPAFGGVPPVVSMVGFRKMSGEYENLLNNRPIPVILYKRNNWPGEAEALFS